MIPLVTLVIIILWCSVYIVWSWMKPGLREPPMYPGALPLIGHGYRLIGDPAHIWKEEQKLYDYSLNKQDIIKIKLGPQNCYVISDPDDSLTLANKCLDRPYIYGFAKDVYGNGLVTANSQTWKPHRKLLNPAFSQQLLYAVVKQYSIGAKRLVSELSSKAGNEPFDLQPYLINTILGIIYRTTMGLKADEHVDAVQKYVHATKGLFDIYIYRTHKVWLHFQQIYNLTSLRKKEKILSKQLKEISNMIIKNRRSELKSGEIANKVCDPESENFKPLLDQLIHIADNKDAFTDAEIREHLDTIVVAAYDTTAEALTFTMILLGSHQDVQDRVYKELQEVFEDQDRHVNRHDLSKLAYMEVVIKESLRLFPPAPRVAKTSSCDIKLSDYTLRANAIYIISTYAINRHPMWGPDADQFRPERWLDPASLPKNPNAFSSFGLGKRNCIGRSYGMMTIKTTLAHILLNYRVTSDISKLKLQCDLMLRPHSGHFISLEKRI